MATVSSQVSDYSQHLLFNHCNTIFVTVDYTSTPNCILILFLIDLKDKYTVHTHNVQTQTVFMK